MHAFLGVTAFEFRQGLRRASTWIYFGIFFLLALVTMRAFGGAWPELDMGSRLLFANSPHRVGAMLAFFGLLMVPVTAAVMGNAVYRDFETGIHPLFFASPVPRPAYLGGRYLGALAVNAIIALAVPLGLLLGALFPGLEAERVGPFRADAFLWPMGWLVLPNLVFTGAVFFSLAALTRRMLPNYAGGVLLLLGFGISIRLARELGSERTAALVDVFGITPVGEITKYWTVWERNHLALAATPELILNRLLWLAVGAAVLGTTYALFRFRHAAREGRGRGEETAVPPAPVAPPRAAPDAEVGAAGRLRQTLAVAVRGIREVAWNVYFPVIVGACLAMLALSSRSIGAAWGTNTWPVTYQVLELVTGAFDFFLFIIITFYAGELVWRERELRASQVVDALPLPGWVTVAGKIAALAAVVTALWAVALVAGVAIQASHGYWRFELRQYLTELFLLRLSSSLLMVVLAVLVHVLVNQKYVGHVVLVVYYALSFIIGVVVESRLVDYGSVPATTYSDMNGYGHALAGWAWFQLYWTAWAATMALAAYLFWVRGMETTASMRLRLAGRRATRPVLVAGAALALAVGGLAGFIHYNTDIRNDRPRADEARRVQAAYEKEYKRFESRPQPRIAAARLWIDLFPERREVRLRGTYRLVNRTAARIDTLHVDIANTLAIREMRPVGPATAVITDREKGYYAWRLGRPLQPGDTLEFRFDVAHRTQGFTHETEFGPVVGNGTFFAGDLAPGIGYNPEGELTDEDQRRRRGLPRRPRIARLDDTTAWGNNEVARDADWMEFEATLSTSPDQIAIAPGYLQREWTAGGRRFFHYRMDAPMLNFYSVSSGRYAVRRDRWRGPGGREVAIEIFHHPTHSFNLDRMTRAVKASLDYYTEHFGPYQHRQVRIVEFPRYRAYAQSFANTIPYSEAIGFIARVGADDIDYPFFVTAHEVAHQWWGHQVTGARVQGSAVLSETLAEYSALMVMEQEYGRARMEEFLRYDLDAYLRGRNMERRGEQPLLRVEYQPYVHYNKGGVAMYALRDAIGEERLNAALAAFLRERRFGGPPYPTSRDLLRHLRAATPDSLRPFLADLFEHVTLWDLSTREATATRTDSGTFVVDMVVEARKLRADSLGAEREIGMRDRVDVGVYTAGDDEPIYLRKHVVVPGVQRIRVEVDRPPARAGIDPQHKLIDRQSDDNVVPVTAPGAGRRRR